MVSEVLERRSVARLVDGEQVRHRCIITQTLPSLDSSWPAAYAFVSHRGGMKKIVPQPRQNLRIITWPARSARDLEGKGGVQFFVLVLIIFLSRHPPPVFLAFSLHV